MKVSLLSLITLDRNECKDGTAVCDAVAICNNTIGGYECKCPKGYEGTGKTCTG